MAIFKSRSKNLTIIKDKNVIKFFDGTLETSDKAIIKIVEAYAKSIPEARIHEIKGGE